MRACRWLFAALAAAGACQDDPVSTVVSSGTINGVPFTVREGTLHQAAEGGPVLGDIGGALVVLDQDAAALGMTDGTRLHLRTTFALRHGGTIVIAAFGPASDPLGSGTGIVVGRDASAFEYVVYVEEGIVADSSVTLSDATVEHTIVTEFYAQDVPGYGAGSGLAIWPIDDLTPSLGEDVIGCVDGPAMSTNPLTGDRVAFGLEQAFILSVEVVDTIVGPCV
jgi:hypothetical protein